MSGGWDTTRIRGQWRKNGTYRTSSGEILVIYPIPMSDTRGCWVGYSFLDELSGSVSDPMMQGEWPEMAARFEILPDCEPIK